MGILIKNKVERTEDALKAKRQYLSEKEKYDNSSRMRQFFMKKPVDPIPGENIERIQKKYDIEHNPKPIEELYAMYKEVVSFAELHGVSADNYWYSPNRQIAEKLEAMIDELEDNGVYMLSRYDDEYAPEDCRLLIADRKYEFKDYSVDSPVVFGWVDKISRHCIDGNWPKLEMVVGDVIFDSGVLCPHLSEVKGKVWQSVVDSNLPELRKYEECKSFVSAYKTFHKIIDEKSKKNIKTMGYYTPEEIEKYNIPHENVIGLLNDIPFTLDNSWKNLQYIQGSIVIPQNTTVVLPHCTNVEGGIKAQNGSTVNLPICTSVKGYILAHANASINLPACKDVGRHIDAGDKAVIHLPVCTDVEDNVIIHDYSNVELPACSYIRGDIISYGNSTIEFRSLSHVSGNVLAKEDSVIILPATAEVGGVIEGNYIIRKESFPRKAQGVKM